MFPKDKDLLNSCREKIVQLIERAFEASTEKMTSHYAKFIQNPKCSSLRNVCNGKLTGRAVWIEEKHHSDCLLWLHLGMSKQEQGECPSILHWFHTEPFMVVSRKFHMLCIVSGVHLVNCSLLAWMDGCSLSWPQCHSAGLGARARASLISAKACLSSSMWK